MKKILSCFKCDDRYTDRIIDLIMEAIPVNDMSMEEKHNFMASIQSYWLTKPIPTVTAPYQKYVWFSNYLKHFYKRKMKLTKKHIEAGCKLLLEIDPNSVCYNALEMCLKPNCTVWDLFYFEYCLRKQLKTEQIQTDTDSDTDLEDELA